MKRKNLKKIKIPAITKILIIFSLLTGVIIGGLSTKPVQAFVFGSEGKIIQWIKEGTNIIRLRDETNNVRVGSSTNPVLFINTASSTVGIGTTEPEHALDVKPNEDIAIQVGELIIGNIGYNNETMGMRHKDVGVNDYAFRQNNSGITYFNGTELDFRIANSSKMVLLSNGNVGIGTTSPNALLGIQKVGTSDLLNVSSDTAGDLLTIDSSGNVGIGTTSPGSALEVYNSTSTQPILTLKDDSGTSTLIVLSNGNVGIGTTEPSSKLTITQPADNDGLEIYGYDDKSDSWGRLYVDYLGRTNLVSSHDLMLKVNGGYVPFEIAWGGIKMNDNDILNFGSGADITFQYDGTNDKLDVKDRAGKNYLMVIEKGGNVGIGTTSPNSKLQVAGSVALQRTVVSADYTTVGDAIVGVTDTSAVRTITLASADCVVGRTIVVKDESGGAGTNNITVATEGTETIDGADTQVINTNYGVLRIYSDGSNWFTW